MVHILLKNIPADTNNSPKYLARYKANARQGYALAMQ